MEAYTFLNEHDGFTGRRARVAGRFARANATERWLQLVKPVLPLRNFPPGNLL